MTMTETGSVTAATFGGPTAATFGRVLSNVGRIASTDITRGALYGVQVACDGQTMTLTASDSYRLIRCEIILDSADTVPAFDPFVIEAKSACKAGKLITRKNNAAGVGFTVTGLTFTLSTVDGSGNVEIITAEFPNVEKLLNPENTGELPRANGWLLADLVDTMADIVATGKSDTPAVMFDSIGGTVKAMRLSAGADHVNVVGLLMPLRG